MNYHRTYSCCSPCSHTKHLIQSCPPSHGTPSVRFLLLIAQHNLISTSSLCLQTAWYNIHTNNGQACNIYSTLPWISQIIDHIPFLYLEKWMDHCHFCYVITVCLHIYFLDLLFFYLNLNHGMLIY